MSETRQIALYGKGGVGKSTVGSNVAISFGKQNKNVLLAGCSPKIDSTYLLLGKLSTPTILSNVQKKSPSLAVVQECIHESPYGVWCVEAGGPPPASGCAGRGVFFALKLLKQFKIFEKYQIDLTIYDVIADVVCGGFSEPMKAGFASEIYIVTSGELMSLYAANNICFAVNAINQSQNTGIRLGGLIINERNLPAEQEIVAQFAEKIHVPILASIPRSELVQKAEARKMPVVALYPDSEIAAAFEGLAEKINDLSGVLPQPMEVKESIDWISGLIRKHQQPVMGGGLFASAAVENKKSATLVAPIPASPRSPRRRIAIYGKAGIGKSTVSSNISAIAAGWGERVLQIGCDPKRDSVALLTHHMVPTVLEVLEAKGGRLEDSGHIELEDIIFKGYRDIYCVESGGPPPGTGCAGNGVLLALQTLDKLNVYDQLDISFALYDVLGDVVCGGFTQPIRAGYCREIYIVTNGELLSLFVTNNILKAVKTLADNGVNVGVAGLINNQRDVEGEREIVEAFAKQVGVPVISHIPRSPLIQTAESMGQTLLEAFPDSEMAQHYQSLTRKIMDNDTVYLPKPFEELDQILAFVQVAAG
jgi:nitrogenase iron protein NifH